MKPMIITTGAHIYTKEGYMQNLLWQVYQDGILGGGGLPLVVTNADHMDAAQLARQADGLFLSGGMDVNPYCYGLCRKDFCGDTDYLRDRMEMELVHAFINEKKPILGICRGFQMLNTFFGGTLYQDILEETGYAHPYDSIHEITSVPGEIIETLFGERFTANSLHHQAVNKLGKDLKPIAYASNAPFVEAFVHQTLPILAVQWHPERMMGDARMTKEGPDMTAFFKYFINMCIKR